MALDEIRRIAEADAAEWHALRLRALREEPHAFLVSVEEEASAAEVTRRAREEWAGPDLAVFGAFRGGRLVGTAGLARERPRKARHKAWLWGMYVAPEARGGGLGLRLARAVLDHAATVPGLEFVLLGVGVRNAAAARVYRAAGFEHYAWEPRSLRVGEEYFDEEILVHGLGKAPPGAQP